MSIRQLVTALSAFVLLAGPASAREFGGGGRLDEYEDQRQVVIVEGKTLAIDPRTRVENAAGISLGAAALDGRVGRYVRFEAVTGRPYPRATRIVFEEPPEDPSELD